MIRIATAYALSVAAMLCIAYGCWLWNEGLGLVVGGMLALGTAVDLKKMSAR